MPRRPSLRAWREEHGFEAPPLGRPAGGSLLAQAVGLWGRLGPADREAVLALVEGWLEPGAGGPGEAELRPILGRMTRWDYERFLAVVRGEQEEEHHGASGG
jgi:hypothetical protein